MGKSGKHVNKSMSLPRTEAEAKAWRKAAAAQGTDNVCAFVRAAVNEKCAKLGINVKETIDA